MRKMSTIQKVNWYKNLNNCGHTENLGALFWQKLWPNFITTPNLYYLDIYDDYRQSVSVVASAMKHFTVALNYFIL